MKATVIIPTYRRPDMLAHALTSAANLDFDPSQYEVCVVNDGGAGVDRHKVRAMWKGSARLTYARITHAGLSAAVNRGIEMAEGTYCTVLPDDDTVLPNKLAVMTKVMDDDPSVSVTYSLPLHIDQNGRSLGTPKALRRFLRKHRRLTWAHVVAGSGLLVHGTGTLYRTEVCRAVGGWDLNLKTGEEYEFHLRLLKHGHDFHGIDAVTTGYRIHDGSKSLRHRKDRSAMRKYTRGKLGL